jgi:homocitrate synthase
VLLPWDVFDIVTTLRKEIKTNIGVHLHNDLGHATTNALFALQAGANWIDTTLLGIGERTGITPLSALLTNLYNLTPDLVEKYSLALLTQIEQSMAEILDTTTPFNLITSKTAFSHKAGIHINGIKKQGAGTYEAIDPEVIGNKRIVVTGSRISGKRN